MKTRPSPRNGAIALLLGFLMLPLLGLMALFVDYGFLLYAKTDLQRSADQAVLAAVRDLVPDADGNQDVVAARATLDAFVASNMGNGFTVNDADVTIGRYDLSTIYQSVNILNTGEFNTVKVTVRRDDLANSSISLFFARLLGHADSNVVATSTAIIQPARYLGPGTQVLPIALEQGPWDTLPIGGSMIIYGDGQIEDDSGKAIAGNWGTVDLGPKSNSTKDLKRQIGEGLSQDDITWMYENDVIPDPNYIDSQAVPLYVNGDTGFSAGIKGPITDNHGAVKIIPIYKTLSGKGGNLTYEIVDWGVVEIVTSYWKGSKKSYVEVKRTTTYDPALGPITDLSDLSDALEGAYTSPALVQ